VTGAAFATAPIFTRHARAQKEKESKVIQKGGTSAKLLFFQV
jgi:hypothetical protein